METKEIILQNKQILRDCLLNLTRINIILDDETANKFVVIKSSEHFVGVVNNGLNGYYLATYICLNNLHNVKTFNSLEEANEFINKNGENLGLGVVTFRYLASRVLQKMNNALKGL